MHKNQNKRVLLLIGGEICHNYFQNTIRAVPNVDVDVIVHHSGKTDIEYYLPIYSVGVNNDNDYQKIVDFILERNSTFARREPLDKLVRSEDAILTRTLTEFNAAIDGAFRKAPYDIVLSYGAPIIRSAEILALDFPSYNIHMGLSRYYRGGDSNIFALASKNNEHIGLTCHKLSKNVDKGDVLFEVIFEPGIDANSYDQLTYSLVKQSTEKLCAWLGGDVMTPYSVPEGELYLNSELTARHVLAAVENLSKIHSN